MEATVTVAHDTTTLAGCSHMAAELGCVLVSTRHRADGRIVLCRREEDGYWITWRTYDRGTPGFHHGHYDMTEEEARADLVERANA